MNTYGIFVRGASFCSLAVAAFGALAFGCAPADGGDEGSKGESVTDTNEIALSYDEFKATYFGRDPDDAGVLLFQGDVAVDVDSEAMRALYETQLGGQRLIVNRIGNRDDKWSASAARSLRYCVSNNFGSRKAAVVNALASATAAWEQVANVNFTYVSSQDANCTRSNQNVTFDVRPVSGQPYVARAFFPSNGRSSRNILIDGSAFGNLGPWSLTGVLTHELGHTLGFRHEHTRPESGTCFEDNNWRALTPYDGASVMHYPQCNGTNNGDLRITSRDAQGARALYP
jgi:hypothetical protein